VTDLISRLRIHLLDIYDHNPFVGLLQMKIDDLREGEADLSMPVIHEVHTNLFRMIHGGALASLADTAMGVACATLGKRVVTLEMNMNFVRSAGPGETIKAAGKVVHNGKATLVMECDITDSSGQLLVKARGTFFVVGQFEPE
jgi:1,4-dihydroxy-2-naphthoyl-CoA hydrolase